MGLQGDGVNTGAVNRGTARRHAKVTCTIQAVVAMFRTAVRERSGSPGLSQRPLQVLVYLVEEAHGREPFLVRAD